MQPIYVLLIDGEVKKVSFSKQNLMFYVKYDYRDKERWDIQEFYLD